jgi:beta-glucosidase
MVSEDTENFDRLSASVNPNQELFVRYALEMNKKVIVVLQNGGALILGENMKKADSIVEMWLGGEAAGGAIADVLCGKVNPSGKLSETFPLYMRRDMDYTGSNIVEYSEKFDVGYRYYDKHPEEILYPFGHGISYTTFEYKDLKTDEENLTFEFTLKNTGNSDGAEIVQLYVGDPVANVIRPIKELKRFEKVFLKAGEEKKVSFSLTKDDLSYYNPNLHDWVAENGQYDIYIGASSPDIKFVSSVNYKDDMPYSLMNINDAQIG